MDISIIIGYILYCGLPVILIKKGDAAKNLLGHWVCIKLGSAVALPGR
jgi:hypothetical protein